MFRRLSTSIGLTMALVGCHTLLPPSQQEVLSFYGGQELQALQQVSPVQVARQITGLNDVFPTPLQREQQVEQTLCLHRGSQNRVVMQQGVSDAATYRQCPVTALQGQVGQRLDIPLNNR